MADGRDGKGFWHTLPGVLTAIADFLTAVSGLLVALNQLGLRSQDEGRLSGG